jgi:small subunit ribosomal protein S6
MRNYELTVVVDGKSTSAKQKSIKKSIDDLIKSTKGKVNKLEEWGKKDLAYKIGESVTGIYFHYKLELNPTVIKQIDEKLKLDSNIIRYLLIREST